MPLLANWRHSRPPGDDLEVRQPPTLTLEGPPFLADSLHPLGEQDVLLVRNTTFTAAKLIGL
jgi:hypothetical protein